MNDAKWIKQHGKWLEQHAMSPNPTPGEVKKRLKAHRQHLADHEARATQAQSAKTDADLHRMDMVRHEADAWASLTAAITRHVKKDVALRRAWHQYNVWRSAFMGAQSNSQVLTETYACRLLPEATAGRKQNDGLRGMRKARSEQRAEEWQKYAPWMDAYFIRPGNASHSITNARLECAKEHKVDLSTVKRHTPGYKKPARK